MRETDAEEPSNIGGRHLSNFHESRQLHCLRRFGVPSHRRICEAAISMVAQRTLSGILNVSPQNDMEYSKFKAERDTETARSWLKSLARKGNGSLVCDECNVVVICDRQHSGKGNQKVVTRRSSK
jgi:hypothetical protein